MARVNAQCFIGARFLKTCPSCKQHGSTEDCTAIEQSRCSCGREGWFFRDCHLALITIAGEPIRFCIPLVACSNCSATRLLRVRHTAKCSSCGTFFDFATTPRAAVDCPKEPLTPEEYREKMEDCDGNRQILCPP